MKVLKNTAVNDRSKMEDTENRTIDLENRRHNSIGEEKTM